MKNYRVTVNGNTYDVSVEELANGAAPAPMPQKQSVKTPVKKETAPVSSKPGEGTPVTAPMPGTILDVKVSVGDKVTENQVVAVLEAMKMENEIVSPVAGTVTSVTVSKSASVNSGDVLVTIAQ